MKKRILSILLTLCMVLTMMPATVFAADGEVAARASETGGLYEHHEACGANSAGASDTMMPKSEERGSPSRCHPIHLYAALRCQRRQRRAAKSERD